MLDTQSFQTTAVPLLVEIIPESAPKMMLAMMTKKVKVITVGLIYGHQIPEGAP